MKNYYALISHHDVQRRDTFYFESQLANSNLSIGWGEINPLPLNDPMLIQAQICDHYPARIGTPNPWNGGVSLTFFSRLIPGDVVFVRGVSKILDVVEIIGAAYYHYGHGHDGGYDYCTMAEFRPLTAHPVMIPTRSIPDPYHYNVLLNGGSRLAMRKVNTTDGERLLDFLAN